ncbi:MAG TPA: protein kinase [Nitrososphaera sp.]|jgi:serine/threonine protein kinase|nr:protein kinase [Nitrososphaera sp.]
MDPYRLVGLSLLDKYRLDEMVAMGGLSVVYKGKHLSIDRTVAVKIIKPDLVSNSSYVTNLFEQEARMLGRLSHENIVNVFDAGRTPDGLLFMVMDWFEGWPSLRSEITDNGPLSLDRTNQILQQVAAALDASHDEGIIHGDVKPENILITKLRNGSERIKLLDWGIGRLVDERGYAIVDNVMGTPIYGSPEQFQAGKSVDRRSDIYSLGVMLYEMLTKDPPFKAKDLMGLITHKLTAQPPLLTNLRKDVPIEIEELVCRMLVIDIELRPQRAGEVAELFNKIINRANESTSGSLQPKIFISYAREDETKARAVYRFLKVRGFYPWLDKEFLLPGADWELEIKRNLMESDFLAIYLSGKSISKRGYVQKEIRMALDVAQELPFGSIFFDSY